MKWFLKKRKHNKQINKSSSVLQVWDRYMGCLTVKGDNDKHKKSEKPKLHQSAAENDANFAVASSAYSSSPYLGLRNRRYPKAWARGSAPAPAPFDDGQTDDLQLNLEDEESQTVASSSVGHSDQGTPEIEIEEDHSSGTEGDQTRSTNSLSIQQEQSRSPRQTSATSPQIHVNIEIKGDSSSHGGHDEAKIRPNDNNPKVIGPLDSVSVHSSIGSPEILVSSNIEIQGDSSSHGDHDIEAQIRPNGNNRKISFEEIQADEGGLRSPSVHHYRWRDLIDFLITPSPMQETLLSNLNHTSYGAPNGPPSLHQLWRPMETIGSPSQVVLAIEWMFIIGNFGLEVISTVLDQLSSVHKPLYSLLGILFSFGAMFICIVELVYKARKEKVNWRWKGVVLRLPWFYNPTSNMPFGTFKDIIGFACAFCQCIATTINYAYNVQKPIKISIWPIIFAFGLLCSKFLENAAAEAKEEDQVV